MRSMLLALAFFAAACGSSASAVPTTAPVTTAPAATAVATASPSPSAASPSVAKGSPTIASGTVTIQMAEHFYSPSFITVAVGTTVVWVVVGVQSHDVHARDGSFDSPLMAPGNRFTYTFTKPGKYPYYCQPHEGDGMFGEVDVQ